MSRTEEISTDVQAVSAAADEALSRAEEILEYTREQIENAFEHGWDGVAQSMNVAGEALEKLTEELTSSQAGFENASATLDQISEQMSSTEVADLLSATLIELDSTHDQFQGLSELVDEAVQGAEQAEHQGLTSRLNKLREEVEKLADRLTTSRSATESEHEHAEKLGRQDQDDDRQRREDDEDDDDQNDQRNDSEDDDRR